MTLFFPDVPVEDFDFDAEWLVRALDPEKKEILFEGQNQNADLEMVISYQNNPQVFDLFSVGELVILPKETVMTTEEDADELVSELF